MKNKSKYFTLTDNEWDKIVKKKNFEKKKSCPVCQEKRGHLIFSKKKLNFFKCFNCSHIYINPFFKKNVIKNYFKNQKSWGFYLKNKLILKERIREEKYKYNLIKKVLGNSLNKKKVLDVGCGPSLILKTLKSIKFHYDAVEPNDAVCRYLKRNNINVYNSTFEEFNIKKKYDFVFFLASFEYLTEFTNNLKKIKNLLKTKKSKLFLWISGNSDSLIMRAMQSSCVGYIFSRKNYFNPRSLNYVLNKNGFRFLKNYQDNFNNLKKDILTVNNFYSYSSNPYKMNKKNLSFNIKKFINLRIIKSFLLTYKFLAIYEKK